MTFLLFTGQNKGLWLDVTRVRHGSVDGCETRLHRSEDMAKDLQRVLFAIHSLHIRRSQGEEYRQPKEYIRKLGKNIRTLPSIMDVSPEEKLVGRLFDKLQADFPEMLLVGCIMEVGATISLAPEPIVLISKEKDIDNLIRVLENIRK